jgi:hypothetical protein
MIEPFATIIKCSKIANQDFKKITFYKALMNDSTIRKKTLEALT